MGGIRLSKDFGVNPTIALCYWCGKEKNEIALLGAAYKGQAPMHMTLDKEPCDECRARIVSKEWVAFEGECGHNGMIKRDALMAIITGIELKPDCNRVRFEKCPQCMGLMK